MAQLHSQHTPVAALAAAAQLPANTMQVLAGCAAVRLETVSVSMLLQEQPCAAVVVRTQRAIGGVGPLPTTTAGLQKAVGRAAGLSGAELVAEVEHAGLVVGDIDMAGGYEQARMALVAELVMPRSRPGVLEMASDMASGGPTLVLANPPSVLLLGPEYSSCEAGDGPAGVLGNRNPPRVSLLGPAFSSDMAGDGPTVEAELYDSSLGLSFGGLSSFDSWPANVVTFDDSFLDGESAGDCFATPDASYDVSIAMMMTLINCCRTLGEARSSCRPIRPFELRSSRRHRRPRRKILPRVTRRKRRASQATTTLQHSSRRRRRERRETLPRARPRPPPRAVPAAAKKDTS